MVLSSLDHTEVTIPFSQLKLGQKIGVGAFKTVFKGTWSNQTVAIMQVREGACSLEAAVMANLGRNKFLVQLHGVARDGQHDYLVTEFVKYGSLDAVLENNKGRTSVTVKICIAEQVAQAMHALLWQGIIHCDLAARNVLVASFSATNPNQILVKVSDFGLSKEAISFRGSESVLPVRWAPPEVLKAQRFSPASDAWAFGVLLWELFTDAEMPYAVLSDKEVEHQVCAGARLPQPRQCPDSIYALMLECWTGDVDNRIHFDGIVTKMHEISQGLGAAPRLPSLKH